ncbi:MAG: glycosyltransferase family 39 protein [Chloroflexota bacterium]|nr:glycosyltransferase family 39 protein [Chloroflexota bacterium]
MAFLAAAVSWGVALAAMTEVLSLFRALTLGWVAGFWGATAIVLLVAYVRLPEGASSLGAVGLAGLSPFSKALLGGVAAILALVGLTALVAPPNTNDALNYHMPRVAHWIQNETLTFYPTSVPWQLSHNPGAEYVIAHFQLLSGSDRWANLVQWFAMAGSVVGVTLLAKDLGADARGQVYAAVVAATIPMGVLQGATAQNDYVVAFWLVAFVHYLLRLRTAFGWWSGAGAGAALGLALLAKATAYLFAFPFLVWFVLSSLRPVRVSLWKPAVAIAAIALALNLGHFTRNFGLYDSPLGPGQEGAPGTTYGKYTNDTFTPTTFASNVVRNLALHTGLRGLALRETRFVEDLHRRVGADPNDPRTTWTGQQFSIQPLWTNEDFAGNHLHLALGLATIGLCLASGRLRRQRGLLAYLVAVIGGFLLFVLVLKWTPWVTRLHLPLFVLFAPIAALALASIRWRIVSRVALLALLVGATPFVFYAERRPLVGNDPYRPLRTTGSIVATDRRDMYFVTRPQMADPYLGAAQVIRGMGCTDIGLHWFGSDEYPWWVVLGEEAGGPLRLQAVNPENVTAELALAPPFNDFVPCAIVSLYQYAGDNEMLTVGGVVYQRVWSSAEVGVFAPPSA